MCNAMAPSMMIILISIVSIAAITTEAVNIDSADNDWNNAHVERLSETSRQNLITKIVPKYNGLDVWSMLELRPRLHPLKILSKPTKTEPIDSQHDEGRRNRRRMDGKTIGEDGGSRSVASLVTSSFPSNVNGEDPVSVENWILQHLNIEEMNRNLEPTLGNRRRRLASSEEISSDKNTTEDPTVSNAHKLSAIKCLLTLALPVSLPEECIQFNLRSLFKIIHGN